MTVLVTGDRNWTSKASIREALSRLPADTLIIHGGCRGADTLAGIVASEQGLVNRVFPADWQKYGKAAGPIRNQQMLEEGKPYEVLAFHPNLNNSKGTLDMVGRAIAAGIPLTLYSGSRAPCARTIPASDQSQDYTRSLQRQRSRHERTAERGGGFQF